MEEVYTSVEQIELQGINANKDLRNTGNKMWFFLFSVDGRDLSNGGIMRKLGKILKLFFRI